MAAGAWVSLLALAETMWVLTTVYGRVVTASLETFRSRPALGFTDCLLVEVARKAGHPPLGTFDRSPSKIDGAEKL